METFLFPSKLSTGDLLNVAGIPRVVASVQHDKAVAGSQWDTFVVTCEDGYAYRFGRYTHVPVLTDGKGYRFSGLNVGCTVKRHRELGVHAAINAKAGEAWRNSSNSVESVEMERDARKVQDIKARVIVRQFNSRWFRKNLSHLLYAD